MSYPYRFVRGLAAACFGAGAEGMALVKPQTNPLNDSFLRPGYMVRGGLAPTAQAFVKSAQQFPAVDLVGNGFNTQGQLALTRLSRMNDGG